MPSSNISLIKRVESGHVLTAADMAALKTPPPGSARSRSQLSGNGSHGTMGSLHGPRSMNAIQAEGYSQRIDVDPHAGGWTFDLGEAIEDWGVALGAK